MSPDPARPGTAVVTGASSGIGAAYAEHLAAAGHDLVLVARRSHRLEPLARDLTARGAQVEVLVADLADAGDRDAVAGRAARSDVDLLVSSAGISGYGPFDALDPAVLARVVDLNVTAPTVLARAALPGMLERGRGAVVNVASLLALAGSLPPDPLPARAVYAGTKGYLLTFTRTLAAELRGTGVAAQVVCPGYTATELHLASGLEPVAAGAPDVVGHSAAAMPADDVVRASLAALACGEVVCVPGLADPAAVDRLVDAELGVRSASGPHLAERYLR